MDPGDTHLFALSKNLSADDGFDQHTLSTRSKSAQILFGNEVDGESLFDSAQNS